MSVRLAKLKNPYYRIRSAVANNKKSKGRKGKVNKKKNDKRVWVSATKTRNYLVNNLLVDVLQHKNAKKLNRSYSKPINTSFDSFISHKGGEFETEVMGYIKNVCESRFISQFYNEEGVANTIKAMKEGVPVIYSAPLKNSDNNTYGIADLIVRSDYLSKIVTECPITDADSIKFSPLLNKNYYYIIIDIKWTTLPLTCNGENIMNTKAFPAYKGQIHIYNEAVGKIQGYTHRYAYLMGKGWKYKSKDVEYSSDQFNTRLGIVDFHERDNHYISKTNDAIDWINIVDANGSDWSVSPPSVSELYPNMKVHSYEWNNSKNVIADDINEITKIWNCGVKHRDRAFSENVFSYNDPKCTAKLLGFKGHRADIIDRIIEVNRDDCKDLILPRKIDGNVGGWRDVGDSEFYVDIELLGKPILDSGRIVYMIGVHHAVKGYRCFYANSLTDEEEYRIINEFYDYIHEDCKSPILWHWGHIERTTWERLVSKHDVAESLSIEGWKDMNKLFTSVPICLKGCFKFGLKSIGETMYKNGFVKDIWTSNCKNGLDSMMLAKKCYDDGLDCLEFRDIISYNKCDVLMLIDIITYLRGNL